MAKLRSTVAELEDQLKKNSAEEEKSRLANADIEEQLNILQNEINDRDEKVETYELEVKRIKTALEEANEKLLEMEA